MDNKDIEILDDFELEEINDNLQSTVLNNEKQKVQEIKEEVTPIEPVTSAEKNEEENPVVEMINNKTTLKLIAIMLIVLFIAVFFMPKVFELIGNI